MKMTALSVENKDIKIKPLQLILVMAMLQLVIAFFTVPLIFSHEESMWQYIGHNWFRLGLVPYTGGVDNKSPLIFFVFGASDWLFGVNYWFPRLLGIAVQSAGIYYLFKIAEKTISPRAGLIAITFYGLSLMWRSAGGKHVSFTETYAVTAIIIAVYFSIVCQKNKHSFIGGLFAGLGFGFRFSAVFGIIPVFIFTFSRNRKSAFVFLLGLLTSCVLLLILAYLAGIKINEFLFYGLADNFGTGSPTGHSLAWKAQGFADGFFYSELILFYPAVAWYFISNRKMDFLKAWLICEFTGIILLGIFARNHFKNLLPVMSLMSAFTISYLAEKYNAPVKKILLGVWIVFFPKTFEPLFAVKKIFVSKNDHAVSNDSAIPEDEDVKKGVGLWIRNNTISTDKVFIAGYGAQLQAYSERVSPTIYFNVTQTSAAKKRLFVDLLSAKPAMIVIPLLARYSNAVDADIRGFIDSLVAKNYRLDTSLYNYNIFRYIKTINP